MVEQMAAHGRPAVGPPRQHQLRDISVVLRATSADGDAYLKCSADLFRHEAVVTRALAERMPGWCPGGRRRRDRGWMLMRDLGAAELGDQDESLWHEGARRTRSDPAVVAGAYREWSALGLPVRSLPELAARSSR